MECHARILFGARQMSVDDRLHRCWWIFTAFPNRVLFACTRGPRPALFVPMVAVIPKRSARQVRSEVRAIKKAGNEINKSAKSARAFLLKNGFITKDNKVSKQYR